MRNLRSLCAAWLIFACFASGCATVSRGGKQKVKFVTEPPGATLTLGEQTHTTPVELTLKRNKKHEVTLTKPGYQGVKFLLKGKWDGGGAGAVALDAALPGGSVLFVVDTLSGSDRKFNEIATINLPPATQPAPPLVTLYEHKGKLLAKAAYDEAVKQDKLFAKQNKSKTTQPTTKPLAASGAGR